MKKILIFLSAILFLIACKTNSSDRPILSVSIEPQKFFLEELVRDKYTVNSIIPNGSNPETFDPSPSQMISVSKSKIFFKIGFFGFENNWLNELKQNSSSIEIVDCSESIPVLDSHACDDDHEHHSHLKNHHEHAHAGPDPHIWSSPKMASMIVDNMYNALVKYDVKNETYYYDNYTRMKSFFEETDSIIQSYLKNARSKSFIIFHPALTYYAQEYGLNQLSIEFEGKHPSPSQLKKVIDQAKKENVKVVFVQAEFDQKNGETIAKELGAKLVSIDLMGYNWQENMIKIAKSLSDE